MARYYYPYSSKNTCEGAKSIPISYLKAKGYLNKGEWWQGSMNWSIHGQPTGSVSISIDGGNQGLRIWYSFDNEEDKTKKQQDYTVPLVTTPCYFGGVRYWFLCPECNKRVGVLYLAGRYIFACRDCWKLTYQSRNLSGFAKLIGVTKTFDEIEEMRDKMRTPYYRDEFTKRHRRIIRAERRLYNSFQMLREKFGLFD